MKFEFKKPNYDKVNNLDIEITFYKKEGVPNLFFKDKEYVDTIISSFETAVQRKNLPLKDELFKIIKELIVNEK